jgi:hypothetical protein
MIAFAPFRCLKVDQSEDAAVVQPPSDRCKRLLLIRVVCIALASESRPAPSGRAARGLRILNEPNLRIGGPAPINPTRWHSILRQIWTPLSLHES